MFLGFSDYAREGTITSSQAFAASAPLANLKTRRLGQRARSTAGSGASFRLSVDLGQPRLLGMCGLLAPDDMVTDFEEAGLEGVPGARVELSNVSTAGSEVWRGLTVGTRYALAVPGSGTTRTLLAARYVSFVFRSGVAHWSCGRLWASQVWWPTDGVDFGWQDGVIDTGANRILRGGANNPRRGVILDTLSTTYSSLQRGDVYALPGSTGLPLKTVLRTVGNTGEVIAVPRGLGSISPTGWAGRSTQWVDDLAIYGRITSDLAAAIQHTDADNYSASLAFVEER